MKNKPVRGFKHLIGETIKKIDASSINCIHIELENGQKFTVHAEHRHYDIGIVECGEYWDKTK